MPIFNVWSGRASAGSGDPALPVILCPQCIINCAVGNGLDRSGDIFAYAVMRFTAGLVIRCGNDNTANYFANVQ